MTNSMKKRFADIGLLTLICLGMSVFVAHSAPVLGTENFDDGLPGGWVSTGSDGTDSVELSGGNPNGYYQLDFLGTGLGSQVGYIFNTDVNHTGSYSNLVVSFSFYVEPVSDPTVALNFYFMAGAVKWSNDFTVPANAWTTVTFDFTGIGWTGGTDFMADVGSVTEIGIDVNHLTANGSHFVYGMDNWTMSTPVPEPESVALAIVAFISLLLTFRQPIFAFVRRRRE
jgi:hypothetical protein